jgi:hypothetical protein
MEGAFRLLLWASLVTVGCSAGTTQGAGSAGAGAGDAGRRVKPRSVRVEIPKFATRELIAGDGGALGYGPIEPLDDVEVCIRHRRDAFAALQPFEELDEPICARAVAGEITSLEAPPDSDLVWTAAREGYVPGAWTRQTDQHDSGLTAAFASLWSILLPPGASDPWLEPPPPSPPGHGQVLLFAAMIYEPRDNPLELADEQPGGTIGAVALARDVRFRVEPADGAPAVETTTLGRPRFLSLPAGPARLSFDHARVSCAPVGGGQNLPIVGLPLGQDAIEILVLPGHVSTAVVDCFCAPGPGDGELLDLGTCTFEPLAADAGAR